MFRLDDDASDEELADETAAGAETASTKLTEAKGELQAERHAQEDAAEAAYSVRQLAEDILNTAKDIEESIGEAKTHGDRAFDLTEEAENISGNVEHHAGMLADRVSEGGDPAAETELVIDGTAYRLRLDPLEEVDVDPIMFRDDE